MDLLTALMITGVIIWSLIFLNLWYIFRDTKTIDILLPIWGLFMLPASVVFAYSVESFIKGLAC